MLEEINIFLYRKTIKRFEEINILLYLGKR